MKSIYTLLFLLVFVLTAIAQVPKPVMFFDFEETEGVDCFDQGTAGNNGAIEGEWVDRVDGGIITTEGETGRAVEFIDETAGKRAVDRRRDSARSPGPGHHSRPGHGSVCPGHPGL